VLAYFGYPAAHENDAERAIRAGIEIIGTVTGSQRFSDVNLQARIGIASGVVVVGDLLRDGITQEIAAVGETTNLAARLQSLAGPNALLICSERRIDLSERCSSIAILISTRSRALQSRCMRVRCSG